MSSSVTLNGTSYTIPATGDDGWGDQVAAYLVALSTGVLSKAGGAFTLTGEIALGATYGIKGPYWKSTAAASAAAGVLRLGNTETVSWRNAGNNADLALTVNADNQLTFNGNPVAALTLGAANTVLGMDSAGTANEYKAISGTTNRVTVTHGTGTITLSGPQDLAAGSSPTFAGMTLTAFSGVVKATTGVLSAAAIVNADIDAAAAIAYSKLALAGSVKLASDVTGTLPAANGGTGVNSTATFPSSGTVVTRDATETLTNKTLTAPVLNSPTGLVKGDVGLGNVDNTSDATKDAASATLSNKTLASPAMTGALTITEGDAPSSPASGKLAVYAKTDDKLYVKNSAGTETAVGAGAGEKNYITGSSTAAGWTASGSGITVTTDTTAADLPRPNTSGSGIKITGVSGSTAYAYARFTLDPADYSKKLKLQLDQLPLSGYANGDFKVDVYSNTASDYSGTSTRLPLSTDSSAVSALPNLTGTYRTTFDSPNATAPYIEVRIGMNATHTHSLVVSDVIVGPGVVVQGAAVGAWQSYSATVSQISAIGSSAFYYRRVGTQMEITGYIVPNGNNASTGVITVALPSGFTVDSTKVGSTTDQAVGTVYLNENAGSLYSGVVNIRSTTTLSFSSAGGTNYWGSSVPVLLQNGDKLSFFASVPIAEWAGSGTVNLAYGDTSQSNPFVYVFNSWHPSSTSGTVDTAPSAGTVQLDNTAISSSLSTGTLTLTFNKAGYYNVSVNVGHQHAEVYTTMNFRMTFGGTATTINLVGGTSQTWASGIDAADSDTYETHNFIVNASAGQTLTILSKLESGGISTAASHTAYTSVSVTPVPVAGQAVGWGQATPTSTGLTYALKQYVVGTTYTNGTPSLTSVQSGFTVTRGVLVPYQTYDGAWRLRFNASVQITAVTSIAAGASGYLNKFTLSGITAKNVSNYDQAFTATLSASGAGVISAYVAPNTGDFHVNVFMDKNTTTSGTEVAFSGDIELDSKPTWAD